MTRSDVVELALSRVVHLVSLLPDPLDPWFSQTPQGPALCGVIRDWSSSARGFLRSEPATWWAYMGDGTRDMEHSLFLRNLGLGPCHACMSIFRGSP